MKAGERPERIYLHPLVVRLWHWLNAACFIVLIITGIQIRYRELPALTEFKTSVAIHNFFGFLLLAAYAVWLLYYLLSGNIRIYFPRNIMGFISGMLRQARYYAYGIFKGEPAPFHSTPEDKFNPMQLIAYFFVMFLLLPIQIATGVLLWDVVLFARPIGLAGGIRVVDIIHVLVSFFTVAFLVVHVYMTTLGRTPLEHIRAMLTGYEEHHG